jgi:predicted PurR-regulated permease PerM
LLFDKKSNSNEVKHTLNLVNLILWIIIIAISIKLASFVKEILYAFTTAILINYFFAKPVAFITKYIKLRFISVLVIILGFVSIISFIIGYLVPIIVTQSIALKNNLPKIVANLDMSLVQLTKFFENYQIELPLSEINRAELLNSLFKYVPKLDFSEIGNFASEFIFSSVYVMAYIFLSIIISFYLLLDGDRAWNMFLIPFSKKITRHLVLIKEKIDGRLNAFLFGQLQVATLTALTMTVAYLVLNVPYALILGLAQFLEIIPVVGTWIAIIPCILIIGLTAGFSKALIAFIVYMIYSQLIRDNFIMPRVMGSSLGFHPLGILLALLIGAQLGSIVGVILAIPVLAVITSVIDYNLELSELKVVALD